MSTLIDNTKEYVGQFDGLRGRLATSGPAWLRDARESAIARLGELGLPTNEVEEYRHTRLAPITATPFTVAAPLQAQLAFSAFERFTFGELECHQLVFVNGVYNGELSSVGPLPDGVIVESMAQALASRDELVREYLGTNATHARHAFNAMNTAFFADGAFIHVPRGKALEQPIHLLFLTIGDGARTATFPRNLVVVGDNAQVSIIESYAGRGDFEYLTNAVTEFVTGDNSVVDHYKMQREGPRAYHVATQAAQHGRSANFRSHALHFGGLVARNDVGSYLGGEGIECELNGLYMLRGEQSVDTHMQVDHASPHCNSHELYKAVLNDRSQGIFRGRIHVHKGAQKTDAYQKNQTILLSPEARMNAKPQLEIYADDVKCTHGATLGQLDRTALFYLLSRGIPRPEAMALLVHAFAADIIERIRVPQLRTQAEELLRERLEAR